MLLLLPGYIMSVFPLGFPELRVMMHTGIRGTEAGEWFKLQERLRDVNVHVCSRALRASHCGVELLERVLDSFRIEVSSRGSSVPHFKESCHDSNSTWMTTSNIKAN